MKSSASESKPFQSRSKGEIPGRARRKERLSRSKLKQAFLIDSDAELFMYLIQCIRFGSWKVRRLNRALKQPPKNRWIRGYSVTSYPRIHEVNIIYNSYCVSVYRRILDFYLFIYPWLSQSPFPVSAGWVAGWSAASQSPYPNIVYSTTSYS